MALCITVQVDLSHFNVFKSSPRASLFEWACGLDLTISDTVPTRKLNLQVLLI
jgi:hypothetical protein